MGGEKKKPTAADKGKAKMPEKKRKTREEKDMEAVLNAVHATQLQSEGRGVQIREPTRRRTTVSGKNTITGNLGSESPLPYPSVSIDDLNGLIMRASQSVVTIGALNTKKTKYSTGFILLSEENFCLVFSLLILDDDDEKGGRYFVYLEEEKIRRDAYVLSSTSKYSIFIVRSIKKYTAVTFDFEQLDYECIHTIGALTGTKLHADANAPLMTELEGALGFYRGKVTVPSCNASYYTKGDVIGSEQYFQLTCDAHDDIITLENVDYTDHEADVVVSAPVFRPNGKVIGIIYSCDVWGDTKIGLLANFIISWIKDEVAMDTWEEELKDLANKWLLEHEN